MNILVLGNGFDLAHELPTKYTDFLKFVEVIKQVMEVNSANDWESIDWKNINFQIKEFIINDTDISVRDNLFCHKDMWKGLLNDNIWIEYFLNCDMYQKENWIDFESEISRVIQSIDKDMREYGIGENTIVRKITNSFLAEYFLEDLEAKEQARDEAGYSSIAESAMSVSEQAEYIEKYREEHPVESQKEMISYKCLIARLEQDLNKLIRALEIYLADYVGNIGIEVVAPDIQSIKIDKVLSFNYTDTFNRLYGEEKDIKYDYIHGEADIDNTIETNNMVLGIDEYLSDDRKDKDIEFIAFKKFYQRIHKQTGSIYKEWVDEIKEEYDDYLWRKNNVCSENVNGTPFQKYLPVGRCREKCVFHQLYIFGHSLDITDKDILRDLILNDNVYTTIFYLNKDVMGQQIANLVKVIGQDELIRRTGGSTKTIEFRLQQDMVWRR